MTATTPNETLPTNRWDSIERVARTLSIVAIPIVLAIGGWLIQQRIQDQAVSRDFVQLAVSILKDPENVKADQGMREWAVQLLNDNSPTKFTPKTQEQLKSGETKLPESFSVTAPVAAAVTTAARETREDAVGWEGKGFNFLLDKDAPAALDAFTRAEKLWPLYDNLSEIKKLLQERQAALVAAPKDAKSQPWLDLYRVLVTKYSYGMPAEIKERFNQQLN